MSSSACKSLPLLPVSVVVPCYLCASTIDRAIQSVREQTILPFEIILIDDASPDSGATFRKLTEIAKSFPQKNLTAIKVLSLPNNVGPGGARNEGWSVATQPYIAFLDADDSWAPDKLERQVAWMINHPNFALSCHGSSRIDGRLQPRSQCGWRSAVAYRELTRFEFLLRNPIITRTVMLRRSTKYRFPLEMRHAEDYMLWLKICFNGERIARLSGVWAYSYKEDYGGGGLSGNLAAMHKGTLTCYRNLREVGLIGRVSHLFASGFESVRYVKRIATSAWRRKSH